MQSTELHRVAHPTLGGPRPQEFVPDGDALWRVFQALPDMVNGDVTTFSFIFVAAGLAAPYRWAPDATFATMHECTTSERLRARIVVEAMFHARLLVAIPMGRPKARVIGIILATARMAGRRAWGFVNDDTVATQRMVVENNIVLTASGALPADHATYGTTAEWLVEMTAMSGIYDGLKDDLLAKVQQVSIGMPACNGATIVRTLTHHYVEPHKGICDTVYNQFIPADQVLPIVITADELKDILNHKAYHAIASPRLVWMSRNKEIIARLEAVGQGGAVVRLPAEFDVERAAGSMLALIQRVAGAGKSANIDVDATPAEEMVAAVKKSIKDHPDQSGIAEARGLVDGFRARWGPDMAFGAGYLNQMFEYADVKERGKSVLKGYAVTKLVDDYGEVWSAGAEHYDLAKKWRKARAAEGFLTGYGLLGKAKPDDFAPPEEKKPASK